jgi:hypothetical protein
MRTAKAQLKPSTISVNIAAYENAVSAVSDILRLATVIVEYGRFGATRGILVGV